MLGMVDMIGTIGMISMIDTIGITKVVGMIGTIDKIGTVDVISDIAAICMIGMVGTIDMICAIYVIGKIRAHPHPVLFGHHNGASPNVLRSFAHRLTSLFVVRHKLVLRFSRLHHRETPHVQHTRHRLKADGVSRRAGVGHCTCLARHSRCTTKLPSYH